MKITIDTKNGTVSSKWNHYTCVEKYGIVVNEASSLEETGMELSGTLLDKELSVDLNKKLPM